MNRVVLIGRVTKDIELKTTMSNKDYTKFTLAVNRRSKEDGADFISCTAWNKTAEIMSKYIHKGDRVGIAGRIQTGSYEKEGHKYYTTEVIVDELEFLEKKSDSQKEPPKDENGFSSASDVPFPSDSDLPF